MKKIVVIGSGIGGLTAANLLAKKGHKVTLFESHLTPGGYIAGFRRKGYYFESGTLAFEASADVFRVMKEIGVFNKIKFEKKEAHRFVTDDFDTIIDSWEDMKQTLNTAYPEEKANIDSYFATLYPMIKGMEGIMSLPSPAYVKGIKKALAGLSFLLKGKSFIKLIKKYGPVTVPEFADRFFNKGTRIYNFLSTFGYPNMSSVGLAGMMEMFRDYWTVKDGMQSWADALADNFKSLGGDLKLRAFVDTILTKDGAAVGVKVGDQVYEADFVLSAGDYKKTFLKLLDDTAPVPHDILEKIKEAPVSESFFTVYAGINMPNDKLRQCMKVAAVMLCKTVERGYADNPEDEDFFSKGPLFVYSPSMINEQLAPDGKSSLMLQTVSPHGWMDNWGGGNKAKYKALKKSVTETFIKRAEKIIPGLSKLIEYSDAATPLTYERYTHNTDGASSSWSWHARKGFYPPGTMLKIDTPVKNLYISSCWAAPNGGVPGALEAGYRCAQMIK